MGRDRWSPLLGVYGVLLAILAPGIAWSLAWRGLVPAPSWPGMTVSIVVGCLLLVWAAWRDARAEAIAEAALPGVSHGRP